MSDDQAWVMFRRGRLQCTQVREAAATRLQAACLAWGVDFGGAWDIADDILAAATRAAPAIPDEVLERMARAYYDAHPGSWSMKWPDQRYLWEELAEWDRNARKEAMRAALSALGGGE